MTFFANTVFRHCKDGPALRRLRLHLGALLVFAALPGCVLVQHHYPAYGDPMSAAEHMRLARIYEKRGEFAAAYQEYEAAVKKDSKQMTALMALGDYSFKAGLMKQAEGWYRKALKADKHHAPAQHNLACVYLVQGELDKAEAFALKAMDSPTVRPIATQTLEKIRRQRAAPPARR